MTDHDQGDEKEAVSRRHFLKNTGLVAGGVVGGSVLGGLLTNQFRPETKTDTKQTTRELFDARMFFDREEDFAILMDATEQIFPKDEHGPGAIELGVPYFIDKQLAGSWGTNAKEYMRDPFLQNQQVLDYQDKDTDQDKSGPNTATKAPTPTPRYQTRLNRGDLFIHGLRRMDQVSEDKFDEPFVELSDDEQIEVLEAFEKSDVEMKGVASKTFFNLLLQMTIEGAYADPVYGGNKNMMGWKMKEYPGPRMAYLDQIEEEDFIEMKQESLRDYQ